MIRLDNLGLGHAKQWRVRSQATTHTMLFAFSICIENTANKKAFSIEYIEA